MTTKYLLLAFLALMLSTCGPKTPELPECLSASSDFEPEDCPDNGTCTFEFYSGSKLQIDDSEQYLTFEVVAGDNLVFHFHYKKNDNPQIQDDEYQEDIYFEAKPSGNSFLISSDQLKQAGVIFGRLCFCPDEWYHWVDQGCLYGTKVDDDTWNVSLNLTTTAEVSTYKRMKQHDFIKAARPE
jgi:hypothetical protein